MRSAKAVTAASVSRIKTRFIPLMIFARMVWLVSA
jgi:hypothetical protein